MTALLVSPITGAAVTGLTSPTYTVVAGRAPDMATELWAVSALGGTQAGVTANSPSSPFWLSWRAPKQWRYAGIPDNAGVLRNVPYNVWNIDVRKGMLPLAGQAPLPAYIKMQVGFPAGADLADPLSMKAMWSFTTGALWAGASDQAISFVSGILPPQ